MKTLELHYPMIQFLIMLDIRETKALSTFKDRLFNYFFNKFIANFDTLEFKHGKQSALIVVFSVLDWN